MSAEFPQLPVDYEQFLENIRKDKVFEYEDEEWYLISRKKLLETLEIGDKEYTFIGVLKGYIASMEHAFENESTEDSEGNSYPFSRLAKGIAIGESDDGNILYLDPDDSYSVWCFHHDGGDVERFNSSFSEWVNSAVAVTY